MQALFSNEIEEVDNPKHPHAPSMYRYTMFIESEGTSHKNIIQQDKDTPKDPMDLDFSFEDVDFGMAFQVIHRCIDQVGGWQEDASKAP